jgi:hypothetical protein
MGPAPTLQLWKAPSMSESMPLVGLDVHRSQTVAAVLGPHSGELRLQRLRAEPELLGAGELSFAFVPSEGDGG